MSGRKRHGNSKRATDEEKESTFGKQRTEGHRLTKWQTPSNSLKRPDFDPPGSTEHEANPSSRQYAQSSINSQLMTGNARKSDPDCMGKPSSAASRHDVLLSNDTSSWGNIKSISELSMPAKPYSSRRSHSTHRSSTKSSKNLKQNKENQIKADENQKIQVKAQTPVYSGWSNYEHDAIVEGRPGSRNLLNEMDPNIALDGWAPESEGKNLKPLANAMWKNDFEAAEQLSKSKRKSSRSDPKSPDKRSQTLNVKEKVLRENLPTELAQKSSVSAPLDTIEKQPAAEVLQRSISRSRKKVIPDPTAYFSEAEGNRSIYKRGRTRSQSRARIQKEINKTNTPQLANEDASSSNKKLVEPAKKNQTLGTSGRDQKNNQKDKNDFGYTKDEKNMAKTKPPFQDVIECFDLDTDDGESESEFKAIHNKRDILKQAAGVSSSLNKKLHDSADENDLKYFKPIKQSEAPKNDSDKTEPFSTQLANNSRKSKAVTNQNNDGHYIEVLSDVVLKRSVKEKIKDDKQDEIDRRPKAELKSLQPNDEPQSICEEIPTAEEVFHKPPLVPADPNYQKLHDSEQGNDLKYLKIKQQNLARNDRISKNDNEKTEPFSSKNDFVDHNAQLANNSRQSEVVTNQNNDGHFVEVLSDTVLQRGVAEKLEDDKQDEDIPTAEELFRKPSLVPADPKEIEAEIDARLKDELDSLPLVKGEESDDAVDPQKVHTADNKLPLKQNQICKPPIPAVINYPLVNNMVKPGVYQMAKPVAAHQLGTLANVPIVTRVKGAQGEDISVKYTTAPDGLITSVQVVPPAMPQAQQSTKLESFTASQLHQILQSGQPYLALPMTSSGSPVAMMKEPLKPRDAAFPPEAAVEDEEVDFEEIGVADTFAAYWPSKLKFGRAHPDSVVETATLSSVELPDISYQLQLPAETTDCLSALQLEAVVYACQAHEQILPSGERAGFLLGDGAGVGKGRTIAGIIFDNYVKGRRRALWISVSNDLKFDAERDLADIGAHDKVQVACISKFKYSRIDSEENENFRRGVIFCTYTALIGESLTANSKYKTRLRQLANWLGKKFEGVIVFDECHKAKNLSLMNVGKSTKTGTTVLELQKLLPNARVVYASATGASEPRNMAYMVRLGLWGPGTAYPEFYEFVNAVEKRGIGAMEIVAMDMKLRGTYIARQLSFKDVSFRIEEVAMPKEFRKSYNLAAELWAEINKKFQKACRLMCIENRVQKIITCQFWCAHQRFFKNLCIASKVSHVVKMTRHSTRSGKAVVIGLQSTGESRTLEHLERHHGKLNTFVSTSKMIIQSFVEKHFPAPKRDSFHHLLNTGVFEPESRSRPPRPKKAKMNPDWFDDDMDAEAGESDIEMYESSWNADDERVKSGRKRRGRPPKLDKVEKITMQERILQHLCNNMRAQDNDGEPTYTFDNTKPQKANITERDVERCINSRELLLEKIEILGKRLPANTLDKLISELGGTNLVAEMTGRRGRVVRTECGGYKYESRCESDSSMDLVNYREKQRFMDGSKHVAIISEAASSGISLQSDKRVSNQRRRLHITLELPWSADRAIQQFGRTHRSNQVNSPEYVFVITDLAGERRFASTVAKRLESLGALTQGDRRATDARDLSQFNIDNSIGRSALESVMEQLTGAKPLEQDHIPQSYKGEFPRDCCVAMAGVGMLKVREENKIKLFSVEKDSNNISKFLNRILGCRVEVQNALFKFFLDKMYSLIMQMKRTGRFDLGILDLDAHGASVTSIRLMRFARKHATGTAATELHTVSVERGMSYETALAKYRKEGQHEHDGFYVLQQLRHDKNSSILCLQAQSNAADVGAPGKINLQIYRPNTGPQVRLETLRSITSRYKKVTPEEAHNFWMEQYSLCLNKCSHVYWNRVCPFPPGCEVGLRERIYHVLSGLMLPIWDRIEHIIEKNGHKIQIIRVKTDVNKKIVGTVVPNAVYDALVADLSSDSIVASH
ncbi:protein strawberry notch homolog 1 [Drosophila gunungcola]|uniref:protein strawberry notch homolog 1 n=1 Tax=Drosophila gunungcola TaxID=103775 RepID=UPI0022E01A82|nr:protein strawberry notch homolog 1 [Drosophila gunungcola]